MRQPLLFWLNGKMGCLRLGQKKDPQVSLFLMVHQSVRMTGVEPACLTALDPKSSASANFATSAIVLYQKIA